VASPVTGVVWIVIGIVVLRFSYATVTALVILFGVFCAAAAVMSFYFIFRGCFDVIAAIAAHQHPAWRVLLIVGLAELAIGFWAAGPWHLSALRLVAWVAAGMLLRTVVRKHRTRALELCSRTTTSHLRREQDELRPL
jgi:hypothetical protein